MNTQGLQYTVLGVYDKIGNNKRYIVKFIASGYECLSFRGSLIDRAMQDLSVPHPEVGNIYDTNHCGQFKITEVITQGKKHNRAHGYFINTGTKANFDTQNLKRGEALDIYAPTIYGIGYLGKASAKNNMSLYSRWIDMIERCYVHNREEKFPNYVNTSVNKRWHCFENYIEDCLTMESYQWTLDNPHIRFDMDKDILGDSSIYSKQSTIFIPHDINMLFAFKQHNNTSGYAGVSLDKTKRKYVTGLSKNSKRIVVGSYDTKKEAYMDYIIAKLQYCDEVLDRYDFITEAIKHEIYRSLDKNLKEVL